MTRIEDLPNLGPKSAAMLADIGIHTLADLEQVGVLATYLRVRETHPSATLNMLWALQGAVYSIPWDRLPPEMKEELRAELDTRDQGLLAD
jgi:DNA transformation protein